MTKRSKGHRSRQAEFQNNQRNQLFIALGFYVILAVLVFKNSISWYVFVWYVVLGIVTYVIYAKDKRAAKLNKWRTPELTLHVLSVLGGWVGAMVAQNYLRHKTQKSEFRLTYYLTVIINLAVFLFIITQEFMIA